MRSGVFSFAGSKTNQAWSVTHRVERKTNAVKPPFRKTREKLFGVRQQRSSRCGCEKLNQAVLVLKVFKRFSLISGFIFFLNCISMNFFWPKSLNYCKKFHLRKSETSSVCSSGRSQQPRISVRLCKPLYLMVNVKADAPEMFVRAATAGETCVNISKTSPLTVMDVKGIVRVIWYESVWYPRERANVIAS